jgi:phage tail-like protein
LNQRSATGKNRSIASRNDARFLSPFAHGPEARQMARIDPLRNFRFRVEIDNIARAGFSEVSGLEATTEAVDYREGTDQAHVRKLVGLTKFANVTLTSGLVVGADALELFRWHNDVSSGVPNIRRQVVVVIQNEAGQDQARFVVADAWPIKYSASPPKASANEVIIELLEHANEGIERVA